jgi:hypothetical protein
MPRGTFFKAPRPGLSSARKRAGLAPLAQGADEFFSTLLSVSEPIIE